MAIWVTPEDVLNRWVQGSKPDVTSETLLTFIDDAEDEILSVYPGIQTRIDALELPLNRVKRVVAGVVIRAYKIAQEYRTSFSESTGPFSHSGSMGEKAPRNITLTEEEIRTLAPDRSKKALSISLAPHMHSANNEIWHSVNEWG